MTTSIASPEVSTMETPTLKVSDRCDRCGAQAFAITQHESGCLMWCAHHFAAHEVDLIANVVVDQRDTINAKPSPSA